MCSPLDAIEGGFWNWNVPAHLITLSPGWLLATGYDPQENATDIEVCQQRVHPADLPKVQRALDEHFEQRTSYYDSHHRIRTGSGQWLWVHECGRVTVRDEAGGPLLMCGAVFNAERSMSPAQSQLRVNALLPFARRLETIGALAGGVAHEYSSLMTVILGDVQMARSHTDPDLVMRSLDRIERVATHAAQVTRSLLTLSQGAALPVSPIRVASLINDTVDMLRSLLPSRIQLTARTRNVEAAWVNADPTLLRQVLVNLAINARDAMPTGGLLHIDAVSHPASGADCDLSNGHGRVVIFVRDNGTGMTEEVRQRVFEPCFSTKPGHVGFGLGMAVVKGIVQEHGGQITVQSSPGRGVCFIIKLPACAPGSDPARSAGHCRGCQ